MAFFVARLRHAFGRHGAGLQPIADCLPRLEVTIFEAGIELIHANAGGTDVGVMAGHAVLLEEGLDNLLKTGIERLAGAFRGLGSEIVSGETHASKQNRRDRTKGAEAEPGSSGYHGHRFSPVYDNDYLGAAGRFLLRKRSAVNARSGELHRDGGAMDVNQDDLIVCPSQN